MSVSGSNHVFSGPCLVINHGPSTLTLYDVSHRQHCSRVSPETANRYLHACHGELLVLHEEWMLEDGNYANSCCLLNVLTMEKVSLPPLDDDIFGTIQFSLMFDSRVFIFNEFGTLLYCELGAGQFTKKNICYDGELLRLQDAIIFQGKMYILAYEDQNYHLYWADQFEDDTDHLTKFTPKEELRDLFLYRGFRYTSLIESCDQLFLVDGYKLDSDAVDFEIFRVDLENQCWEEVDSIGKDRAFFVDNRIAFSAPVIAGSGIQGNCIYYVADVDERDASGTMHAYHLEDHSVTTLSPLPFKLQANPELRWLYIE